VAQYLTKGKQIYAEGQPEVRSFQRQDGTAGASLSMRVREVQLLGGRAEAGSGPSAYQPSASAAPASNAGGAMSSVSEPVDDLPF